MKILLAIITMLSPAAAAERPNIEVGEPFPVVELPLCGTPSEASTIMDYRGRKLMLHLFASW